MSPEAQVFTTSDEYRIHFRTWIPDGGDVKAIIVCQHGIQSHSQWYEWSAQRMAEAGYAVYFPDRRGSGLNCVLRGHADHADRLLSDIKQMIGVARRRHPHTPVFLLGLSWGGKTALTYALERGGIDRLILLYPGLVPFLKPRWYQRFLLWFARTHDIRRRLVPIPLRDARLFTDVPQWQEFIGDDPLAIHDVTTGLLNTGLDLDARCRSGASTRIPSLLFMAGKDQIINNLATAALVQEKCADLTTRTWQDAQHTLEFDPQRVEIFTELINWMSPELTG